MRCLYCRFRVILHHISSDSNPGLTLKEPSRLRDRDVLRSCLYQSKEKINKKPDFGRSYRHLSFSKQPMKTGHSTLLCYIIPSLPHPLLYNTIFTSSGLKQIKFIYRECFKHIHDKYPETKGFDCSFHMYNFPSFRQPNTTSPGFPSDISSPAIFSCPFQGKKVFLVSSV